MKKTLGFLSVTAIFAFLLWGIAYPQTVINGITAATLQARAWVFTAIQDFTSKGLKSPLKVGSDYTMTAPATGPNAVISATGGSCSTGTTYRWYEMDGNAGGFTTPSPAGGDYTPGAGLKKADVTFTTTAPTNAVGKVLLFSRSNDSHSIKYIAAVGASAPTTADAAYISSGTTTATVNCLTTGLRQSYVITGAAASGQNVIPMTTTTGLSTANNAGQVFQLTNAGGQTERIVVATVAANTSVTTVAPLLNTYANLDTFALPTATQLDSASINTLAQGYTGFAAFAGGNFNFINQNARRLDLSGTFPRFSSDGGANFGNLLMVSSKLISVCPSGCQYATLNAACAANTSTSATPIIFWIGPGNYSGTASCSGQDHASFIGSGQGVTTLGAVSADTGLSMGTSTNILIADMTLQGFRGLQWGGGLGVSYVRRVEFSSLNSGGTNEDCSFVGADTAAGSELHYELNRCHQADDGLTTFGDAHLSVFSVLNTFDMAAVPDPNTNRFGSLIAYSAPCKLQSLGDTFNLSYTMTAQSSSSPDYGIDAYVIVPGGTNCATSTIDIRNAVVNVTNSAANALGSQAQGIYLSSAATMVSNVDISGSKFAISVPNDASAGNSRGIVVDNATTVVSLAATKIRATGGQSGTRYDIKGNTAASVTVDRSDDFLLDNGLLVGDRSRNPQVSKPATCTLGDVYMDTSGAYCVCTVTGNPGTWANMSGAGTCV